MYISLRGKTQSDFIACVLVQANVVQCPFMKSKKFILQEECEENKGDTWIPAMKGKYDLSLKILMQL